MIESPVCTYDERVEAYKSTCQAFGRYLDGLMHGSPNSKNARDRKVTVQKQVRRYGQDSMYRVFETPYVHGYALLTQTLNVLGRFGVRTGSDLIEFEEEKAMGRSTEIGVRRVQMIHNMTSVVQAEKDLYI
jgi:hypothetical protein